MTEKQNEPQISDILASIQNLMSGAATSPDGPQDSPSAEPARRPPEPGGDLVSGGPADQTVGSFARLDREVREQGAAWPDEPLVGDSAVTLDDMVRDLVRPMLKDWLDHNLPAIVERLVREEVRRLAGLAKKRNSL